MIVSLALAALLQSCAPAAHPQTMAAIISVESSGWPWTIHDNDADRSYYMPTYEQGVWVGEQLINAGHNVDIGMAQVNYIHLREYGLSVAGLMAKCNNVRVGSQILHRSWERAVATFGPTREALDHTMMAYNTGSLYHGKAYRDSVIRAAGTLRFESAPASYVYPLVTSRAEFPQAPRRQNSVVARRAGSRGATMSVSQRIAQYPSVILGATEVAIPR